MSTRLLKRTRNAEKALGAKSEFHPGTFGCHELLDRTAMIADMTERYLLEHPACRQNEDWKTLAERAVEALNELYQSIGSTHLSK